MLGIQIEQPGVLKKIEMGKPVITEEQNVLVKMKAVGICGSDVGIYRGTNAAATYPRVIGHEMVGVVEEVGKDVSRVKIGDRVIVNQVISCGTCYACKKNRGNVCDNLKVRGVHVDGGCREYIEVPEKDCFLLPDNLTDEEAVMIEPTTIAIQSCSRAALCDEDTLLILGCGALGNTILKIARLKKAKIIVADIIDEKVSEALKQGADYGIYLQREDLAERVRELTNGYGVTVSIDAACTKDSLIQLLNVTGNAGRVVTMGFSTEPTEVNQFLITSKELDVRGSRLQNKKFQEAIDLICDGKLDLKGTISHIYAIEDVKEAFDFARSQDPSIRKIVLKFT